MTLKRHAVDFMAHKYTAEIGFQGANLDVDFLTSFLDLTPSMTRKKESGRFKRCWSYNGHLEAGFKKEWDTLEEVVFILRKLSSRWISS